MNLDLSWPHLWFFLIISFVQEIVFWNWKAEIFDWNPETKKLFPEVIAKEGEYLPTNKNGEPTRKMKWADRKKVYQKTSCLWRIYRFSLEVAGIFVGWSLILFVYKAFLSINVSNFDISGLWNLLLALIIGLVGIAGRIPIIIDSVQDWFKRE